MSVTNIKMGFKFILCYWIHATGLTVHVFTLMGKKRSLYANYYTLLALPAPSLHAVLPKQIILRATMHIK